MSWRAPPSNCIDPAPLRRELQVIWGAVLQIFVLFPSFRHLRLLNIAALLGTTFTACFLLYEAHSQGFANMHTARLWPAAITKGSSTTTGPQVGSFRHP